MFPYIPHTGIKEKSDENWEEIQNQNGELWGFNLGIVEVWCTKLKDNHSFTHIIENYQPLIQEWFSRYVLLAHMHSCIGIK